MSLQPSTRRLVDADLEVSLTLPAANANANSDSIDIEAVGPAALESVELEISVPELTALVEDKTLTVTVQDSADDTTFASIAALGTLVVTGGSGDGADATSRKVRLPSTTRRYIRINAAVEADGGDNTGSAVTYRLLN